MDSEKNLSNTDLDAVMRVRNISNSIDIKATNCTVCRLEPFPCKLYRLLEEVECAGLSSIISWSKDGRFFIVHKPKVFANTLMKAYFNQSKYKSFQRQLNLYEYRRTPRDNVLGIYSHPLFFRGKMELCKKIKRPPRRYMSSKKKKCNDVAETTFVIPNARVDNHDFPCIHRIPVSIELKTTRRLGFSGKSAPLNPKSDAFNEAARALRRIPGASLSEKSFSNKQISSNDARKIFSFSGSLFNVYDDNMPASTFALDTDAQDCNEMPIELLFKTNTMNKTTSGNNYADSGQLLSVEDFDDASSMGTIDSISNIENMDDFPPQSGFCNHHKANRQEVYPYQHLDEPFQHEEKLYPENMIEEKFVACCH